MAKVDRRILKTQEALRKAVIELMADKNFDDITIQDIADQANLNRGTIYLHYQDKYDLLNQIMEAHIQELKEMDTWACEGMGGCSRAVFRIFRKELCAFFNHVSVQRRPFLFQNAAAYVFHGRIQR